MKDLDFTSNTFCRSSAVDVVSGAQSRRGSYRAPDEAESSTPQISGLSVDEDRPIRRRGSQLYVISKISAIYNYIPTL